MGGFPQVAGRPWMQSIGANFKAFSLERDDFSAKRHRAPGSLFAGLYLRMISAQTRSAFVS
jgi:hypothetical protein